MRASVRASTSADAPQIASLMGEVFGFVPGQPAADPRQMHWKYWQERGDWSGPRSFVLARGDQLLAHAGVVPGTCLWGTDRLRVLHLIDWVARPGALGAGMALLKDIGRLADAYFAVGGSAQTLAILPSVGFRPHGRSTRFVRALRPFGALRGRREVGRRRVPELLLQGVLATATSRARAGSGWQARAVGVEDLASAVYPVPSPTNAMAVLERTSALLRHVLECPAARMAFHTVERAGETRGYFLLAFRPGEARLADCWVDSTEPADWRALIELAVREARRTPDAGWLLASATDPLLSASLLDCGFLAGRVDPVQLLAPGGRDLPEAIWRVQMIDNDFAWL